MSNSKVIIIFLFVQTLSSFAFVCNQSSTEQNMKIDFERLVSFNWTFAAKIEMNQDTERPVSFPLHNMMTIKMVFTTPLAKYLSRKLFAMEFFCGKFYAFLSVTPIEESKDLDNNMVYGFCSINNVLVWPKVDFYYSHKNGILVMYFCSSSIEYVVILTKTRNLTKEKKLQIVEESEKILKEYSSNLLSEHKMTFVDEDGASSEDCREMNTDCQRQNYVDENHLNNPTAVKETGKNFKIFWIASISILSFLIFAGFMIMVMKIVEIIKQRSRRNFIRSVTIIRPFSLL